jgi:hypothetical protein
VEKGTRAGSQFTVLMATAFRQTASPTPICRRHVPARLPTSEGELSSRF